VAERAKCGPGKGFSFVAYGLHLNESAPPPLKLRRSARPSGARRPATLWTVTFAMLASACVAIGADVYAHFTTGAGFWMVGAQTDQLPDGERSKREQSFVSLGVLPLRTVQSADVEAAVAGMRLTPVARETLLTAATMTPGAQPQRAAADNKPLRLAWITLWDTDVQDGDVVRINSQGYSRTVTLTKGGETFAVPVPDDGVVTVTGIMDGDGGGITVGLASGAAKAVFPIMSTGQSIGLRVALD
jgi:hypothetical protein